MSTKGAQTLRSGRGEIFTVVDPDTMRAFFRQKDKQRRNKVTTVGEAISQHVHDGDYIAVGGFGGVRIPTALLHEIVRQRKKQLGFAGHVATHDCQILAAGNCFDRCDAAYVVGLEARGLSKNARRVFESGHLKVTEWSNAALAWRFKAAAMGVPFLPVRSMLGTDTLKYSSSKVIECPFTGEPVALVPALVLDVGVIHVNRADKYGNCQIDGITGFAAEMARASKRLIISAEEIVDNEEIRKAPDRTIIPYYLVDAVVHAPFGSHPGEMNGVYDRDEAHIKAYFEDSKDPEKTRDYLDKWIYGVKNHEEYMELVGADLLEDLRIKEA